MDSRSCRSSHCSCISQTLDDVEIHPQIRSLIESLSIQSVDIIGRRGLLDASFSPSELREVIHIGLHVDSICSALCSRCCP